MKEHLQYWLDQDEATFGCKPIVQMVIDVPTSVLTEPISKGTCLLTALATQCDSRAAVMLKEGLPKWLNADDYHTVVRVRSSSDETQSVISVFISSHNRSEG